MKIHAPMTYASITQLFENIHSTLTNVLETNEILLDFSLRWISDKYHILQQPLGYRQMQCLIAVTTDAVLTWSISATFLCVIYICQVIIYQGSRRYSVCIAFTLIISSYLMKSIHNFPRCSHQDDTRSNQFPKGSLLSLKSWKNSPHVIDSEFFPKYWRTLK